MNQVREGMSFFIGLLAGILGGLLGIGGGIVMIPLMVGFLKVTQHKAHGTSLAAMVFVGTGGSALSQYAGSIGSQRLNVPFQRVFH